MYQSEYIPEGSGNDSALLDLFKMNLINVSNITEESIQKEKLNFKNFLEKYRWYGEGDYLFLKQYEDMEPNKNFKIDFLMF